MCYALRHITNFVVISNCSSFPSSPPSLLCIGAPRFYFISPPPPSPSLSLSLSLSLSRLWRMHVDYGGSWLAWTLFDPHSLVCSIFLLQMSWINFYKYILFLFGLWISWSFRRSSDAVDSSACFRVCHCCFWGCLFDYSFLLFSFLCIGPWRNPFISYFQTAFPKLYVFHATLFNHSLRLRYFPTSWKHAFIWPLFEVNPPRSPSNTRSIANSCEMS